jgi:hypothetical protein
MVIARVPVTDEMADVPFEISLGCDVAFLKVGAVHNHPASDLLIINATDYVVGETSHAVSSSTIADIVGRA